MVVESCCRASFQRKMNCLTKDTDSRAPCVKFSCTFLFRLCQRLQQETMKKSNSSFEAFWCTESIQRPIEEQAVDNIWLDKPETGQYKRAYVQSRKTCNKDAGKVTYQNILLNKLLGSTLESSRFLIDRLARCLTLKLWNSHRRLYIFQSQLNHKQIQSKFSNQIRQISKINGK